MGTFFGGNGKAFKRYGVSSIRQTCISSPTKKAPLNKCDFCVRFAVTRALLLQNAIKW